MFYEESHAFKLSKFFKNIITRYCMSLWQKKTNTNILTKAGLNLTYTNDHEQKIYFD